MKLNHPFFEDLVGTLNRELLKPNHNDLKSLYIKWSDQFSDDLKLLSDLIKKESLSVSQKIPHTSVLNGIDLPTWFGEFENKKIIFLGIDPMRNDRDFNSVEADISRDVLVGTPYAFHIKAFRENRTSAYWQVIRELAKSNFVYVTDIYKTFFYTDETKKIRSYDYWNKAEYSNHNQNHRRLLVDEINLIEPDLIVTFGALAYKVLTNQKYCPKLSQSIETTRTQIKPFTNERISQSKPIQILPLMHLSGSTRGHHLEDFFNNNGMKYSDRNDKRNIAGYLYGQIINDIIKKMS